MRKPKTIPKDAIIAPVVSTSIIAAGKVANGRTIPVFILSPDKEGKINALLESHADIPRGACQVLWGDTYNHDTIFLYLEFINPMTLKIIIPLDTIKDGKAIDFLIHSQCLYLMTGYPKMKLSENLDKPRILLEIPSQEFAKQWKTISKKKACKHFRNNKDISAQQAKELYDGIQKEFEPLINLRLK